jgi:outer membrane usher protein
VQRYNAPNVTTVSVGYGVRLPHKATLSMTLSRAFGAANGGTLVGANLSVPLSDGLQTQATVTRHGGVTDAYASASYSSFGDTDFGWRALTGNIQHEPHHEAGIYYGGKYGRVFSDISAAPNQTSLRSGLTGGLVFAAGRPFLTKRVDQSFGVVEAKGLRDIGVGLGSTTTARTDENGIALIPFLTPYQQNQVRLNANDVPISAEIDSIEKLVVPSWRSAVKIDFAVRSGRAALLKLVLDDGEPAPAGGLVNIEGDSEEFYVARRGEVYVTGMESKSQLRMKWNGQSCTFTVTLPPAAGDDVARVGPVLCSGVKR